MEIDYYSENVQDENDNSSQSFLETGLNNTEELFSESNRNIIEFLEDEDLHLSFTSTNVPTCDQDKIQRKYDIDGLVVEIQGFANIKVPLHYIFLKHNHIQDAYHLIKKHSIGGHLQHAKAMHFAFAEGFRFSLCIVPEQSHAMKTEKLANLVAGQYFKEFCQRFKGVFQNLQGKDLQKPSVRKNTTLNLENMNVLPPDQDLFMEMLDSVLRSMAATMSEDNVKFMLIASQFGMKETGSINVKEFFNGVVNVSIHIATEFTAKDNKTHLFWSRDGVRELVGTKGQIFSCLSMCEAAHFQSNLDGREMDITQKLLNFSKLPVTFIQLYADTPHSRCTRLSPHPISGRIYFMCALCIFMSANN